MRFSMALQLSEFSRGRHLKLSNEVPLRVYAGLTAESSGWEVARGVSFAAEVRFTGYSLTPPLSINPTRYNKFRSVVRAVTSPPFWSELPADQLDLLTVKA